MNGYGIAVIVLVSLVVLGMAVMVVAGAFAITRHPDRNDGERNARRYVGPALAGFVATVLGMLGLLITLVVGIVDLVT